MCYLSIKCIVYFYVKKELAMRYVTIPSVCLHFSEAHLSKAELSKSRPGIVSGPVDSASSILSSGPIPGITPCEVRLVLSGISSGKIKNC